ncbi:MAG: pyruvate kinase [Nanoarchaeota archaeon]|nr:pyruvate kinase [Nanoarchaeota archaeon]
MKKTKILCTIGPASGDRSTISKMIEYGMNAARLNLSHGTFDEYKERIANIRKISDIPIILDTKGPEVRIFLKEDVAVNAGYAIRIGFSPKEDIFLDFNFYMKVKVGHRLFIEDGRIKSKVIKKDKNSIVVKFTNSGIIKNAKGINLPDTKIHLPILHKKDEEGIRFAKSENIDFIALSFTRTKYDVLQVRKALEGSDVGIIAKIENKEGLDNFADILKAADGIMVARGDLGVELPSEKIPMIQKKLINECNLKGKFVITATQMLQSMIDSPTPTRAETSDVANAILDGTDTIMLSAETAIGKYPVLAVKEMSRIAKEVEKNVTIKIPVPENMSVAEAITHSVQSLQESVRIDKIVCLSRSGYTARMISRFKLKVDVIAITPNISVKKKLDMFFGLNSVVYPDMPNKDRVQNTAIFALKHGILSKNEVVMFTGGIFNVGKPVTNLISIHKISDMIEYLQNTG